MKIQIEVDDSQIYFVDVPKQYKDFVIKNYGYAGIWLVEKDSISLNPWKISLPNGYRWEILGFVNDVIIGEIVSDKNFILRKVIYER